MSARSRSSARRGARVRAVALVLLASAPVAGCSRAQEEPAAGGASSSAGPSRAAPGSTSTATPTRPPRQSAAPPSPDASSGTPTPAPPTVRLARQVLARLSVPEQVGQLLMVGIPAEGSSPQVLAGLSTHHVGNLFLKGRSAGGVRSTADVVGTAREQLGRGSGVPPLVATDQEGGKVQVLTGPGFSMMPAARVQGSWSPPVLRRSARRWAGELRAAGVNLNLAPVADIVPNTPDPRTNGPIGFFDRQFGATAAVVGPHARAFVRGMSDAHVASAVKHFPGLGHVRDNTDTSSSVIDDVVGPNDPGLAVFRDTARVGTTMVMASTATYRKLDASLPAAFSPLVVDGLLRRRLGFSGVVISDDLGSARAVQRWAPGRRAVLFVAAGGDLVLTVEPRDVSPMAAELVREAEQSMDMRRRIRQAALRVLVFKARLGLLTER